MIECAYCGEPATTHLFCPCGNELEPACAPCVALYAEDRDPPLCAPCAKQVNRLDDGPDPDAAYDAIRCGDRPCPGWMLR